MVTCIHCMCLKRQYIMHNIAASNNHWASIVLSDVFSMNTTHNSSVCNDLIADVSIKV